MPEKSGGGGAERQKPFADYIADIKDRPAAVSLSGYVGRGSKEGTFSLNTGGQTVELPVEAVQSYKVVQEGAPQHLVELTINAAKLPPELAGAAALPFVLATPHHAPASMLAMQPGFAAQLATQRITNPAVDQLHTQATFDTPHTVAYLDYLQTSVYLDNPNTSVYLDNPNTSVYADNPNTSAYLDNPGTPPYVDYPNTSVYADNPNTSVYADNPNTSVYADNPNTSVYADNPNTSAYLDNPNTPTYVDTQTLKEAIKDPIVDPITAFEHGGGNIGNPVWNLPGTMM